MKTHSAEAQQYLSLFLKSKEKFYAKGRLPLGMITPTMKFYPATRICDVALEALLYSKYKNVQKVYESKLKELIDANKIKPRDESGRRYYKAGPYLSDRKIMIKLRNALLKEYR